MKIQILLPFLSVLISILPLPSQSQPLPYTPQWRTWATVMSLSRFQPKPTCPYNSTDVGETDIHVVSDLSALDIRTDDPDETNGTALPILTQLTSFEQFVAEQKHDSWGDEGALRIGGKSVIKALTQIDTQFPIANSVYARTKRVVNSVQLSQGETTKSFVKLTLPNVKILLDNAVKKISPVKGCRKVLKGAQSRLNEALGLVVREDWKKVSGKVLATKKGIEVCLRVINHMQKDYGQKGMSSAAGLCVKVVEMLTRIDYSRGPRQKSQSVINFVSDRTDPGHFTSSGANYQLRVDGSGGSRLRYQVSYTSGSFSASIKCPSGSSSGSTTSFYLSTPLESGNRSSIIMEFYGDNKRRVFLNTVENNTNKWGTIVDLGFDCSTESHTYTLVWSPSVIMWYVDKILMRIHENEGLEVFPYGTRMSPYLSLLYASTAGEGSWSTGSPPSPLFADFKNVKFATPTIIPPSVPQVVKYSPIFPISMDFCSDHMETGRGTASIKYDNSGCGGRFHSAIPYQYGFFSTEFKCATGNTSGFVSSFYLSSTEGSPTQDEMDFEWLGNNKYGVQTNVYVEGNGGQEVWIPFDFDCSEDFHTYDITYSAKKIEWRVDGTIVRTMYPSDVPRYPTQPVYVYGSIWDASSVHYEDWYWAGQWNGGADSPWTIYYKNMKFLSPA